MRLLCRLWFVRTKIVPLECTTSKLTSNVNNRDLFNGGLRDVRVTARVHAVYFHGGGADLTCSQSSRSSAAKRITALVRGLPPGTKAGTLRSTQRRRQWKVSEKNLLSVVSNYFMTIPVWSFKSLEFMLELKRVGRVWAQKGTVKSIDWVLTYSKKWLKICSIVVVQGRQTNRQISVIHVQSCWFCWRSRCRRRLKVPGSLSHHHHHGDGSKNFTRKVNSGCFQTSSLLFPLVQTEFFGSWIVKNGI